MMPFLSLTAYLNRWGMGEEGQAKETEEEEGGRKYFQKTGKKKAGL